jgi:hypothetical protein
LAPPPTSNDPIDSASFDEQLLHRERESSIQEACRDQQRAFEHAAQAIASGESSSSGDPTSFGVEIGNLEEWAHREGTLIAESKVDALVRVSNSTSEHEVFYRTEDSRAVKRTWPGVYGQIPILANGNLDRRNAAPSEYLNRMALHVAVFGSDIRLEGVTSQPDNPRSSSPNSGMKELESPPMNRSTTSWWARVSGRSRPLISDGIVLVTEL